MYDDDEPQHRQIDLLSDELPWEPTTDPQYRRILHYTVPDGVVVVSGAFSSRLRMVGEPGDTIHAYDTTSGLEVSVR